MLTVKGTLIIEGGSLDGKRYALPTTGALRLGRETDCDIRFDPQRERMVGRYHARVEVRPDGVFVTDCNSANKTWWTDDTPLAPETPRRLQHGDRFLLGGDKGPWVRIEMAEETPKTLIGSMPHRPSTKPLADPMATVVFPLIEAEPAPRPPDNWNVPPPARNVVAEGNTLVTRRDDPTPQRSPVVYVRPDRHRLNADPAAEAIPAQERAALVRQAALIAALLILCGAGWRDARLDLARRWRRPGIAGRRGRSIGRTFGLTLPRRPRYVKERPLIAKRPRRRG